MSVKPKEAHVRAASSCTVREERKWTAWLGIVAEVLNPTACVEHIGILGDTTDRLGSAIASLRTLYETGRMKLNDTSVDVENVLTTCHWAYPDNCR
eukprot:scaffold261_cov336-Pavlova_lutheri.AAC.6